MAYLDRYFLFNMFYLIILIHNCFKSNKYADDIICKEKNNVFLKYIQQIRLKRNIKCKNKQKQSKNK